MSMLAELKQQDKQHNSDQQPYRCVWSAEFRKALMHLPGNKTKQKVRQIENKALGRVAMLQITLANH